MGAARDGSNDSVHWCLGQMIVGYCRIEYRGQDGDVAVDRPRFQPSVLPLSDLLVDHAASDGWKWAVAERREEVSLKDPLRAFPRRVTMAHHGEPLRAHVRECRRPVRGGVPLSDRRGVSTLGVEDLGVMLCPE